jgi:hypothetical protein
MLLIHITDIEYFLRLTGRFSSTLFLYVLPTRLSVFISDAGVVANEAPKADTLLKLLSSNNAGANQLHRPVR